MMRRQYLSSIQAGAGMIRSMLGPCSALKQVIVPGSHDDSSVISTAGDFLRCIKLSGPARSAILDAVEGQEHGSGIGVTWAIVLGGLLVDAATRLEGSGHPTRCIVDGLRLSTKFCIQVCDETVVNVEDVREISDGWRTQMALVSAKKYQSWGPRVEHQTEFATIGPLGTLAGWKREMVEENQMVIGASSTSSEAIELRGTCRKLGDEVDSEFDWFFEEEGAQSAIPESTVENSPIASAPRNLGSEFNDDCESFVQREERIQNDNSTKPELLASLALGFSRESQAAAHIALAAALQFDRDEDFSDDNILYMEVVGPCEEQSMCIAGICFSIQETSFPSVAVDIHGLRVPFTLFCFLVEAGINSEYITEAEQQHLDHIMEFATHQSGPGAVGIFFGGKVSSSVIEELRKFGVCVFCDIPAKTIRWIGKEIGTLAVPSLQYADPLRFCPPKATVTVFESGWHPDPDVSVVRCTELPAQYLGVVQPSRLGRTGLRTFSEVESKGIGGFEMAQVQTLPQAITVVLCSASLTQLHCLTSRVKSAVKKLSRAFQTKKCLPGGGALELTCAVVLMEKAKEFDSSHQMNTSLPEILKVIAEGLIDCARIVVLNKGYNSIAAEQWITDRMDSIRGQISMNQRLLRKHNLLRHFPMDDYSDNNDVNGDCLPIIIDDYHSRQLGLQIASNLAEVALNIGFFSSS